MDQYFVQNYFLFFSKRAVDKGNREVFNSGKVFFYNPNHFSVYCSKNRGFTLTWLSCNYDEVSFVHMEVQILKNNKIIKSRWSLRSFDSCFFLKGPHERHSLNGQSFIWFTILLWKHVFLALEEIFCLYFVILELIINWEKSNQSTHGWFNQPH